MLLEIAQKIHHLSDEVGENIYENVTEALEKKEKFEEEHEEQIVKIAEKKEFVKFLVSMNPEIVKILNSRPSMKKTKQMVNCVKIKYFRKALLEIPFSINDEEYGMIMNHAKFLYHPERK